MGGPVRRFLDPMGHDLMRAQGCSVSQRSWRRQALVEAETHAPNSTTQRPSSLQTFDAAQS